MPAERKQRLALNGDGSNAGNLNPNTPSSKYLAIHKEGSTFVSSADNRMTYAANDKVNDTVGKNASGTPLDSYYRIGRPWASTTRQPYATTTPEHGTAVDRWLEESVRDQPWNNVHGVFGTRATEDLYEDDTNTASKDVAGTRSGKKTPSPDDPIHLTSEPQMGYRDNHHRARNLGHVKAASKHRSAGD